MTIDPGFVGTWLVSCLATYLIHSTCLLGSVWALLRARPATGPGARELLWRTALVGGLLTTSAQLLLDRPGPFGELPVKLPGWGTAAEKTRPLTAITPSVSVTDRRPAGFVVEQDASATELSEVFADPMSTERVPLSSPADHATGLPPLASPASATGVAWGVPLGAVAGLFFLGLLRCLAQTLVWRRRLVGASELSDGKARRLLDELCRVLPGNRSVRLLTAPRCSEPAACGLSQWTIVLPTRSEHDLSEDELRSLLAHELAHLVRGDAWWLLVSRVICSCCGFQPLNHLARREWQRAAEHLCDAWAVSRTGSRLALARCLAEVAGWRAAHSDGSITRADCAASLAATGRRSELAARIERLIDDAPLAEPWKEFRARRKLAALAGTALLALAGFGPRINVSAEEEASTEINVETSVELEEEFETEEIVETSIEIAEETDLSDASTSEDSDPPAPGANPVDETARRPEVTPDVLHELILDNERELAALERELAELHELLKSANLPPHESRLRKLLARFETQRDRRRETLERLRKALGSGDRRPPTGKPASSGPRPLGIDFAFPVRPREVK